MWKSGRYSEKRNPDGITATVTNYYYDEIGRKVQFAIDPEAEITCDNIRNKKHMRIDGKIYTDKNTIENIIANTMEREVTTEQIGELVMDKLKSLDEVAYVRFASVYRQFKDINTFMSELSRLLSDKK